MVATHWPIRRASDASRTSNACKHLTRRHFLKASQLGLGAIALSSLLAQDAPAGTPVEPSQPARAASRRTSPAKAKRVIYLHLTGSPPHLDLFDYKPELVKRDGQDCPDEFLKGKRFAFTTGDAEAARHAAQVRAARQGRRRGCPTPCRTCTTSPTSCASSTR